MCKGDAPQPADAVEMKEGIVTSTQYCCTPEYSFPELCQIDFAKLNENSPEFSDCGGLDMDIARNQPGDFEGSFNSNGLSSGVVICTSGSAALEIAEEDTAGSLHNGDLLTVQSTCFGNMFSFAEIQDLDMLRVRIEYLRANGVERPPTCPGGVGHEYGLPAAGATALVQSGTSLKDLLALSEEEIFCNWRVLGFKAEQYKKLTMRSVNHTGTLLEMYMFGKHKLEVRSEGAVLTMHGAEPEHFSSSLPVTSFVDDLRVATAPDEKEPKRASESELRGFLQAKAEGVRKQRNHGDAEHTKGTEMTDLEKKKRRRVGRNSMLANALSTTGSFTLTAGAF